MRRPVTLLAVTLLAPLLAAGCSSVQCGPATTAKVNPTTNALECVPVANASGSPIPCNLDAGARLVGGRCEGDPSQFPTCGPGTVANEKNICVPVNGGNPTPKPCSKPTDPAKLCMNGVVRYLKDGSYTKGRPLTVRAYNPFDFLADPNSKPLAETTTDDNGTYLLEAEAPALGTIAVAITDVGGPTNYLLSGSGAQNVMPGGSYQVDAFAVEKTLVMGWDQQAGNNGPDSFLGNGAYVGIYVSGKNTDSPLVPGVTMTFNGQPALDVSCFKGDRATIEKGAAVTDAATGSCVHLIKKEGLGNFSGSGGGVSKWESGPGTSVAGVVFVQVFHPAM